MRSLPRTFALSLCVITLAACADTGEEELQMDESPMAEQPAAQEAAEPAMASSPLARWAGNWEATAIMESGDTVPYTFTATEDRDGWTTTLPDREPMQLRILVAEADSVVTEMGPYPSLLREDVQVTVRQVARLQNGSFTGTMEARYEGGEGPTVVSGEVEGSRIN